MGSTALQHLNPLVKLHPYPRINIWDLLVQTCSPGSIHWTSVKLHLVSVHNSAPGQRHWNRGGCMLQRSQGSFLFEHLHVYAIWLHITPICIIHVRCAGVGRGLRTGLTASNCWLESFKCVVLWIEMWGTVSDRSYEPVISFPVWDLTGCSDKQHACTFRGNLGALTIWNTHFPSLSKMVNHKIM